MTNKKCTIKILDEVNCKFEGLTPNLHSKFNKMTRHFVKGAFMTVSYKMGRWDGYKNLYNRGKYFTNLISEDMFEILQKYGYDVEVVNQQDNKAERDPELFKPVDANSYSYIKINDSPMELRPHQRDSVNLALESYAGIFEIGTGGGKTFICGAIADKYAQIGKVLVIVPTADLSVQTARSFAKMCKHDVAEFHGNEKGNAQIIIGTWQSLIRYPEMIDGVQCIIADECHEYKAQEVFDFLSETSGNVPFRFGFTGTLPESDLDKDLIKSVLGPVLLRKPVHELQEEGYLAKLRIEMIEIDEELEKDAFGGDWTAEQTYRDKNPARQKYIKDLLIKLSENNMFHVLERVEHGKYYEQEIEGSVFLYGASSNAKRQKRYDEYDNKNGLLTICTTGIFKRGNDIPRMFVMSAQDMGKGFTNIIQTIGRSLRLADGKSEIVFYDIYSNTKHSAKHARKRRKFYKEAKYPHKVNKVKYKS